MTQNADTGRVIDWSSEGWVTVRRRPLIAVMDALAQSANARGELHDGLSELLRDLGVEMPLSLCESCGQPAQVTLDDGSAWCYACDKSAAQLGYDGADE
jgi:hypothetical protein